MSSFQNRSLKRGAIGNLSDSEDDIEISNKKKKLSTQHEFFNKTESTSSFPSYSSASYYSTNEIQETKKIINESSMGAKLMKKMGHEAGKGLGKYNQGIVKPIVASEQTGKQGLGFGDNKANRKMDWNFDDDPVSAIEAPDWLLNEDKYLPELETLKSWKKIGKKKRILDDEDNFCSTKILKDVLKCKSIFDNLENKNIRQARSKANPFESIGACFFQNRAAMKMANIDAVFDFMFTDPKNFDGTSKIEDDEPLFFCDVCAGPGGFSEYVLWRKKWMAKGFGMTLKCENDFVLDDFVAGSPEYFETHYGKNGIDGDGDVTKPENLIEFSKFVLEQTNNKGLHFMMADGGFSVEGNENIQEILSKQLYLCQFLCALCVLRVGGNFVCKIFDIFTQFSVGLIYLFHLCFDRIAIHKPVTSRPANSERYIVCEGLRESKDILKEYLFHVNDELNKYFRDQNSDMDVNSIVPLSILKNDSEFYNYIKKSNEHFGAIQSINLKKIEVFSANRHLYDNRQSEMYEQCLQYWKIPNLNRSFYVGDQQQQQTNNDNSKRKFYKPKIKFNPNLVNHKQVLAKLNDELKYKFDFNLISIGNLKIKELNTRIWEDTFKKSSIFDFKTTYACGNLILLLGCGRTNVYELELNSAANCFNLNENNTNGTSSNQNYNYSSTEWRKLDTNQFNIELPRETLLVAEKVVEYRGLEKGQLNSNAIHLIDAIFIDGENMLVNDGKIVSLPERNKKLKTFLKSITKNIRSGMTKIRVRELFDVESLNSNVFLNLEERKPKSRLVPFVISLNIPLETQNDQYVYPSGIYFFKIIQSPWSIVLSKKTGLFYYYNCESRMSIYEQPTDNFFFSSTKSYLDNGFVWKIENFNEQAQENHGKELILGKEKLIENIDKLNNKL